MTTSKGRRVPVPPGYRLTFTPWRHCPVTGQRLYARDFGYRAWPILVRIED